jgi:hypothetical protein
MDIQIFKLMNGDEIIAHVLEENKTEYFLDTPMAIIETLDPQTQVSVVLLTKYAMFDPLQVIRIKKSKVLAITSVVTVMQEYYINSIEYSQKVVEPAAKARIALVNQTMREFMDTHLVEKAIEGKVFLKSSNTMH